MNPLFSINFRREAHRREATRTRRRALALGLWASYFGTLTLLLGLYGMNGVSLVKATSQVERMVAGMRALQGQGGQWDAGPTEVAELQRYAANARQWRDRLVRLGAILPSGIRLTALAVNPDNLASPADQQRLVLTGEVRRIPGRDHMKDVMDLISTLHRDSVFSSTYGNVKLVSTRISEAGGKTVVFVVECR